MTLPHPPVRGRPYRLVNGVLRVDDERLSRTRTTTAARTELEPGGEVEAGEVYLALARVRLEDETAIIDFCERFGTLGVRHEDFAMFRDFPRFQTSVRRKLTRVWDQPSAPLGTRLDEGLEDFRFGARCVRDLVRAGRILAGDDDGSAWESLSTGAWIDADTLAVYQAYGTTPNRAEEAEVTIRTLTDRALEYFRPRLMSGAWDQLPGDAALQGVPLYATCCLEVYNHLVEGANYKRCANESCGNLFVRQKNRAVKGQYRSHGIMYCTQSCANAQTQRTYRRRQRAARSARAS